MRPLQQPQSSPLAAPARLACASAVRVLALLGLIPRGRAGTLYLPIFFSALIVSQMRARLVRLSVCCSGRTSEDVPTLITCTIRHDTRGYQLQAQGKQHAAMGSHGGALAMQVEVRRSGVCKGTVKQVPVLESRVTPSSETRPKPEPAGAKLCVINDMLPGMPSSSQAS